MASKFHKISFVKKTVYIVLGIILFLDISYLVWINILKKEGSHKATYYKNQYKISHSVKIRDIYLYYENWKDSISLSDLSKNGNILILRIPLVTCQQCAYAELNNLKVLFDQNKIRNICAIITVGSPRDLKALTLSFDLKFLKIGSTKQDLLAIPEEKLNMPYYFILHSDLEASMFFLPDPGNKNSTFEYFKKIKEDI